MGGKLQQEVFIAISPLVHLPLTFNLTLIFQQSSLIQVTLEILKIIDTLPAISTKLTDKIVFHLRQFVY